MKTKLPLFLVMIVLLVSFTYSEMTADEIIQKNIVAQGGIENLKAITTMKKQMSAQSMGMKMTITTQIKRPNKGYFELVIDDSIAVVQYTDGKIGWTIDPMKGSDPVQMTDQELAEALNDLDMDGPFVNYKEKGSNAEFIGEEKINNQPVLKVKFIEKIGKESIYCFDKTTYKLVQKMNKQIRLGQEIEVVTTYSDFRKVNNVFFSFVSESRVKGEVLTKGTVEKIEINIPIDDELFVNKPVNKNPEENKK